MSGIEGFDQLQRQLAEAQAAMAALNGEVAKLQFDPGDPASVEAAVRTMEQTMTSQ